jgi:hypothetical protein
MPYITVLNDVTEVLEAVVVLCASYKPPSQDSDEFMEALEDHLLGIEQHQSIFLIDDLNLDLLLSKGNRLIEFIS